jgi:tRNA(Ile)-lysidine synthase
MLERLGVEHLKAARDGSTLRVSVLRRLPEAERINALRVWLAELALPVPDYDRMREIAGPMLSARADGMPSVRWQGAQLRRHGDHLLAYPAHETDAAGAIEVERWNWRTHPWLSLGLAGSLGLVRDRHGDVRLAALPSVLSVRYRRGGERLGGAQGRFALKDLLQRKGLVPWVREHVPLVMHDHTVVAVADLWLCPQFAAHSGPGHSASGHSASGHSASGSARARFRWRQNGAD